MTPPLFLTSSALYPGATVELLGSDGHHAADVLRLRPGEALWLADGAGTLATAVVSDAGRGRVAAQVDGVRTVARADPSYTVVQALARGGRDELAVATMTEVGVDRILGWSAQRSVARWTERTLPKWRTATEAAARQARRAWLPEVIGPVTTAGVVERIRGAALGIVLDRDADLPLVAVDIPDRGEVVVVVGPEGGVSDAEREAFRVAGALSARLGPEVLRASTAGVVALAVLAARTRWR